VREFKKIIDAGGLRGWLAEYMLELMVDYFRLCSECNKYQEVANMAESEGDRLHCQREANDSYARAEELKAVVIRLRDMVAA